MPDRTPSDFFFGMCIGLALGLIAGAVVFKVGAEHAAAVRYASDNQLRLYEAIEGDKLHRLQRK